MDGTVRRTASFSFPFFYFSIPWPPLLQIHSYLDILIVASGSRDILLRFVIDFVGIANIWKRKIDVHVCNLRFDVPPALSRFDDVSFSNVNRSNADCFGASWNCCSATSLVVGSNPTTTASGGRRPIASAAIRTIFYLFLFFDLALLWNTQITTKQRWLCLTKDPQPLILHSLWNIYVQ